MSGRIIQRKQDGLTDKDRLFCSEYAIDFNQTRAAKVVGAKASNAQTTGARYLKRREIQQEIKRIVQRKLQAREVRLADVLERLRCMAFRDVLDLCDPDGYIRLERLDHLPAEIRYCIEGLKIKHQLDREGNIVGQTIEVKLASSREALDMFMRYFGAYNDKLEITGRMDWDSAYQPPTEEQRSQVVIDVPKGNYRIEELYEGKVGE